MAASEGAAVTTELLNGSHPAVAVTDGFCVYRITNAARQSIRVTAAKGEETIVKEFGLSGLLCERDPNDLLDNLEDPVLDSGSDVIKGSGKG